MISTCQKCGSELLLSEDDWDDYDFGSGRGVAYALLRCSGCDLEVCSCNNAGVPRTHPFFRESFVWWNWGEWKKSDPLKSKMPIKQLRVGDMVRLGPYTQVWSADDDVPGLPESHADSAFVYLGCERGIDDAYDFWCDGKMYYTLDADQSVTLVGRI